MDEDKLFNYFWNHFNLDEDYWSIVGFSNEEDYLLESRRKYLTLKRLGFNTGYKILDVGCGTGILPYGMSYEFVGTYIGCDIHQKAIDYCRKKYSSEFFSFELVENNEIIQFGSDFDFIVFYSVFTHLMYNDIKKYLEQSLKMLNPNGLICCDFFLDNQSLPEQESSVISYNSFMLLLAELKCSIRIIKQEITDYKGNLFNRVLLEMRK